MTGDSLIIHWFGQNGRPVPKTARFTAIPVGLNCFEHAKYQHIIRQQMEPQVANFESPDLAVSAAMRNLTALDPWRRIPPPQLPDDQNSPNWALLNFDMTTDETGNRQQ